MKPETLNNEKKYSLNMSKPEILDDFWKDCIDKKEKRLAKNKINQKNDKLFINTDNDQTNKQKIKNYLSNKLSDSKGNNKGNNNINTNRNNKRINEKNEKYLMRIIRKHPSFIEEMKNEEIKKIKRKNALNRCLGLYSYGLELQKNLQLNKENNEIQKKKNDISLCTFKPKINKKILYLDDKILEVKYNKLYNNPNQNKTSNNDNDINNKPQRQKVKSVEHVRNNNFIKKNKELEECTFKPKFVKDPGEMEKMLKHRRRIKKSISERRENEEFILRYTKARDEYLIKRFKKLNKKDDSYDNSLLSLTKRLCNKQYKNYLNVNNTILLFGETINTINTNNYINSSIADFRGLTIANTVPERKKQKIDYVVGLRKNLHNIDLNESENEQ